MDFETRCRNILQKESAEASLLYFMELKFDGLGVSLHYENGKFLQRRYTRKRRNWEDITENLKTIHNIPLTIPDKEILTFGESRHDESRFCTPQ